MTDRKRTRRAESFCKTAVERTISASLQSYDRSLGRRQRHDSATSSDADGDDEYHYHKDDQQMMSSSNNPANSNNNNKVSFSEQTPLMYTCSNFDKNMTLVEMEQRKTELWYSKTEFEDFLRERIATIHMLKGLGDAVALRRQCPDLCLRGLEPFQATHLNTELQCQRQLHQKTVLAEQLLFKQKQLQQQKIALDAQEQELQREHIRRKAEERSQWARTRAQQLATLDAMEAQGIHQESTTILPARSMQQRRTSAMAESARLELEGLNLLGAAAEVESAKQQQEKETVKNYTLHQKRLPSPNPTPRRAALTFAPPQLQLSARRVPVDLAILKEWNAQFLNDMRAKGVHPSAVAGPGSSTTAATSNSSRMAAVNTAALGIANSALASPASAVKPMVNPSPTSARPTLSSLSSATAQTRLLLRKDGWMVGKTNNNGFPSVTAPSNRLVAPIGNMNNSNLSLSHNVNDASSDSMLKSMKNGVAGGPNTSVATAMLSPDAFMRWNGLSGNSNGPSVGNNRNDFRFQIRRDSVLGTSRSYGGDNPAAANGFSAAAATTAADPYFRFNVRRDSLQNVNCS